MSSTIPESLSVFSCMSSFPYTYFLPFQRFYINSERLVVLVGTDIINISVGYAVAVIQRNRRRHKAFFARFLGSNSYIKPLSSLLI